MTLIINTSNLYIGGGLQVALSFINELRELNKDHQYHIFLSQATDKQIDCSLFPANFHFYLIALSPASLKTRNQTVAQLDALEEEIKPDVVFSVFGPSYWKPKSKHLMGFAIPWLINPNSEAFKQLSFLKLLKSRIRQKYSAHHIKKNADYYVVETQDTKDKLNKVVEIDRDNIFVVGNTVNNIFYKSEKEVVELPKRESDEFRLLTISYNYKHKNLTIIKEVIPYLKTIEKEVKFYVTLDDDNYNMLFNGCESHIVNVGIVKVKECPSLYEQCDVMFLPTLLECFSASYPEAMKMDKPILTSNLSFATDVCGDAALYFNPLDPKDIADKIIQLIEDKALYNELIIRGKKRLNTFETAQSRAEKYIEICEKIIKGSDES